MPMVEENIGWNRLRAPAVDTPAHDLHVSDCLDDLQPGDHIEIQWRKSKEFPYASGALRCELNNGGCWKGTQAGRTYSACIVALAHTIGHVAATISMPKVAVSFTHIIKSGEPAFSVLVSKFLLGESFPWVVYLSLLPIIAGCALSAITELNFNMIGFMGAMISNMAFLFRNIFSKKGMKGTSVSGMNYYACLSMLSRLILTPFTFAMEGPQIWAAGWQTALSQFPS